MLWLLAWLPAACGQGAVCRDGALAPDPAHCDRFLKCSAGAWRGLPCPPGLLYSEQAQVCDWPAAVSCPNMAKEQEEERSGPELKGLVHRLEASLAGLRPHAGGARGRSPILEGMALTVTAPLPPPGRGRYFPLPPGARLVSRPPRVEVSKEPKTSYRKAASAVAGKRLKARVKAARPSLSSIFHASLQGGAGAGAARAELVSSACGLPSAEPLSDEVERARRQVCTLEARQVEAVRPGRAQNPGNVRRVEALVAEEEWSLIFPAASPAYTYTGLLQAVAKFPAFCGSGEAACRAALATLLAHVQHETEGLRYTEERCAPACSSYCGETAWVTAAFPCRTGAAYHGRGAKQLSWNYNYGQFSLAMFGTESTLLDRPQLVAESWLNFASAIWFFLTPQPPKPSIASLVAGGEGFGATIAVINGGLECGAGRVGQGRAQAAARGRYYRAFGAALGVPVDEARLDCGGEGAAYPEAPAALHWAPETGCSLVGWQTGHSALLEGEWARCRAGL